MWRFWTLGCTHTYFCLLGMNSSWRRLDCKAIDWCSNEEMPHTAENIYSRAFIFYTANIFLFLFICLQAQENEIPVCQNAVSVVFLLVGFLSALLLFILAPVSTFFGIARWWHWWILLAIRRGRWHYLAPVWIRGRHGCRHSPLCPQCWRRRFQSTDVARVALSINWRCKVGALH